MIRSLDQLESTSLGEQYPLQRWLGGDDESAFYQTVFGPEQRPAVLKLIRDHPGGDAQLAAWEKTFQMSHPNLLAMLEFGRAGAGPDALLYAVFEFPDDNLASAVKQGPLSEGEARDVLAACLPALRQLHENGLAHTAVDPDHVVAVGDTIKLATDTTRQLDGQYSASEDVRALGSLIHTLLGGGDISRISMPLRAVIGHTELAEPRFRWTLDEIEEGLNPRPAPPVEAAIVEASSSTPLPPAHHPVRAEEIEEAGRPRPSFPKWGYAALAAIFLGVVFLGLNRKPDPPPKPAAIVPATAPVLPVRPQESKPDPFGRVQPPAPVAAARGDWRVIAYTYSKLQDAQKTVDQINSRFPGFLAEVFVPSGAPHMYLVALGGRMTRQEAFDLQRRAISKGLPRGAYAQNFSN